MEPEPEQESGHSDGSGSSQIPHLREAPAPKTWTTGQRCSRNPISGLKLLKQNHIFAILRALKQGSNVGFAWKICESSPGISLILTLRILISRH